LRTQIYVSEAENDIDTTCRRGGAEKTTENGGSRRPKSYTGGLRSTGGLEGLSIRIGLHKSK
jgi:hypothetical protein